MPFKSEAQRRYLWANEPEIARDWTDTYGSRIQKNTGGIMRVGFKKGDGPAGGATIGSGSKPSGSPAGSNFTSADDRRQSYQARSSSVPKGQPVPDFNPNQGPVHTSSSLQDYNHNVANRPEVLLPPQLQPPIELNKREQALQNFLDHKAPVPTYGLMKFFQKPIQAFSDFNASVNRPFFEKVIRAGKIPGLNFDMTQQQFEDAYQRYMSNRLAGKTDAYGNPMQGFEYGDDGLTGRFRSEDVGGGGGGGGIMDIYNLVNATDTDTDTEKFKWRFAGNQPTDVVERIEEQYKDYDTV